MISIGIVGFGNIGRGVKKAAEKNPDVELAAIFTRRPEQVKAEVADVLVLSNERAFSPILIKVLKKKIDVMVLCGGSKEDTPVQGPEFAARFNTVDSFDTHADINGYFRKMNAVAKKNGSVCIISAGWDPGIFSLERVLGNAFLPQGKIYTFWGKGVSQGHSDAARKVEGVLDARQYTIPIEGAIRQVRSGETPELSKREMHRRVVYVVPREKADLERIKKEIIEMPKYFDEYDTAVMFISKEKMARDHSDFPHGGFVMASGATGEGHKTVLEYGLKLESNPEFTASVLLACARAAYRLQQERWKGAFTMLDFPLGYLSPHSGEALRERFV